MTRRHQPPVTDRRERFWVAWPPVADQREPDYLNGRLESVFNNGKAVYLGFKNPHRGALVVRILAADWGRFAAPPESLYRPGMLVRVRGVVSWYQGDPQILVHEPGQIAAVTTE